MKNRNEIIKKIVELTPEFEKAQESYFSVIKAKQSGENISQADFIKIESEYEVLKKEIETLQWVVYGDQEEIENEKTNEDSFSN
ncbi:MAG: hypothetical protein AABY15_00100 [Nanoarchaeota archaeon]